MTQDNDDYNTENGYMICPQCGNTSFTIHVPEQFFVVDQIEEIICANCGAEQ